MSFVVVSISSEFVVVRPLSGGPNKDMKVDAILFEKAVSDGAANFNIYSKQNQSIDGFRKKRPTS